MHRTKSKLTTVALVAAIGLAVPALAKSIHNGKVKTLASLSTRSANAMRERALNVYGRTPTFGAPNPNNPALINGGNTGYNATLYVY